MVGYPSYGLDSQNYFSTKQSKAIKSPAMDSRNSPKSGKPQSRPFNQHNNNSQNYNSTNSSQNYNRQYPVKPKSPSGQKQSIPKFHQERQNSSPKPIINNKNHTTPARYSPNSLRSSPTSLRSSPNSIRSSPNSNSHRSSPNSHRSSPSRSTVSPSRSSPSNFASSTCYQPPTPSSLPKPPVHWTCQSNLNSPLTQDPSAHLKLLLNVQA
eukprot:TRINITY_DN34505_c0_g1_i1.p1 TRINITY_DN34505_c0_g1~~TRINITY_DN34505_c0_g1_i1.p1  ORF type:complete len:210 (-),score=31.41 TRINITY_DN34505_c0_g1_i1:671-1300(-)